MNSGYAHGSALITDYPHILPNVVGGLNGAIYLQFMASKFTVMWMADSKQTQTTTFDTLSIFMWFLEIGLDVGFHLFTNIHNTIKIWRD